MRAAILAGGRSRRMGEDKALIEVDGVPMIERVIASVSPHVDATVIIANRPGVYERFGPPVYPDTIPGMGPLSGLVTAFEVTGADELLLTACDMPLLGPAMVRFIVSQAHLPGDAVIPVVEGREQGLLAIYRKSALATAWDRIQAGAIQFDEFRRNLKKSFIGEERLKAVEPALTSFLNVNRPEDFPRGG